METLTHVVVVLITLFAFGYLSYVIIYPDRF